MKIMKKINLLLAVLVAILVMFSSCEEDDSVEPKDEPKITTEDLVGDWGFVSLKYDGMKLDNCDELTHIYSDYSHGILNFYEMTEEYIDDYQIVCSNTYSWSYYSLEDSVITIGQNLEFKIIKCNESILKLELIDGFSNRELFIGGIYTLEKVQ